MASLNDIPDRVNGTRIDASWFNTIKSTLTGFFGIGEGSITVENNVVSTGGIMQAPQINAAGELRVIDETLTDQWRFTVIDGNLVVEKFVSPDWVKAFEFTVS